jgi:hypothetical protein
MHHQLAITVNGEPRDEVVLAAAGPLVGILDLTLEFDRFPARSEMRILRMKADETDHVEGAYRFRRCHWWPQVTTGVFRATELKLRRADGNSVKVPLSDEIIVESRAPAEAAFPVFVAR